MASNKRTAPKGVVVRDVLAGLPRGRNWDCRSSRSGRTGGGLAGRKTQADLFSGAQAPSSASGFPTAPGHLSILAEDDPSAEVVGRLSLANLSWSAPSSVQLVRVASPG